MMKEIIKECVGAGTFQQAVSYARSEAVNPPRARGQRAGRRGGDLRVVRRRFGRAGYFCPRKPHESRVTPQKDWGPQPHMAERSSTRLTKLVEVRTHVVKTLKRHRELYDIRRAEEARKRARAPEPSDNRKAWLMKQKEHEVTLDMLRRHFHHWLVGAATKQKKEYSIAQARFHQATRESRIIGALVDSVLSSYNNRQGKRTLNPQEREEMVKLKREKKEKERKLGDQHKEQAGSSSAEATSCFDHHDLGKAPCTSCGVKAGPKRKKICKRHTH